MRESPKPGPSGAGRQFEKEDDGASTSEQSSYEELVSLKSILHFPEEAALRLTDTEYQLFYQVPPIDYLRQVTLDLGGEGVLGALGERHMIRRAPPTHGQQLRSTVRALIRRFNEVSAWVTELLLCQMALEERKAILSCILRIALTCWNVGNFNGAMEIVAGLKSNKLKTFWFSISDEPLPALDFLSAALLSAEYERALGRALAMPECRPIPFFGAFLRELREILAATPALTSGHSTPTHRRDFKRESTKEDRGSSKKDSSRRESSKRADHDPSSSPLRSDSSKKDPRFQDQGSKQVYIASFDEEGEQTPGWRRVGPEGLVNLEKVYRTQAVMDHIASFHQHHHALLRTNTPVFGDYLRTAMSSCDEPVFTPTAHKSTGSDFENEALYELDGGAYSPVQPLSHDHGVTMFPLAAQNADKLDRHVLQILHHGTACVVAEAEMSGAAAQLRLERACALLAWCRTAHRPHSQHGDTPSECVQVPEVSLSYNPEEVIPLKYTANLTHENEAGVVGEEGYIDLQCVKDMRVGGKLLDSRDLQELLVCARRHGLDAQGPDGVNIITLVYGNTLSDNRTVHFMFPIQLYRVWSVGLHAVIKALMSQAKLADRSLAWLKNKYTALYYEDGCCCEPLVSDAIRVFGGRDSTSGSSSHSTPVKGFDCHSDSIKATGMKFKKNKSTSELKSSSPKNYGAIHNSVTRSEEEMSHGSSRHSSYSASSSYQPTTCQGPRHSSLTANITTSPNRSSLKRLETSEQFWKNLKHLRTGSVGYDTQLEFVDFVALFRSFSLVMRSELRDVFEQLAVPRSRALLAAEKSRSSPELFRSKAKFKTGLLTRNGSLDIEPPTEKAARKKAFDLLAAAALPGASSDVGGRVLSLPTLGKFCETRQNEPKTEQQLRDIIQRHEPDPSLRAENCLSFEGFVRFLTDKDNYAFVPEQRRASHYISHSNTIEEEEAAPTSSNLAKEMSGSLSQYYIASSHNTYLTGHQLKGESSVELYSQVLLTGCRCVELDCWDGDDGSPVIYHGHTFTTKIPFRRVAETIARSAFVTSPYPLILSIENHCSLPQQQVMATTFEAVFGEKLVSTFLFEIDYTDEPRLPSPEQLKYKVLIKNKKLLPVESSPTIGLTGASSAQGYGGVLTPAYRSNGVLKQTSASLPEQGTRTCSIMSNQSGGSSLTEYFSDEDYDEDDEELDEKELHKILNSMEDKSGRTSLSLYQSYRRSDGDSDITVGSVKHTSTARKRSNQIARELSDMVTYVQAIKFRGLNPLSPRSSMKQTAALAAKETAPCSSFESSESSDSTGTAAQQTTSTISGRGRCLNAPAVHHPCYKCSSVNEAIAKKICRKHPLAVVAHTETQLVRTYPAGLRIDSSNFDPVMFWSCGVQLVALNYQTEDAAMAINAAMVESNGSLGYVRKARVMWDPAHIMYRRFNPMDKEFDGIHAAKLTLAVISGQYVAENVYSFYNAFVEVEILGVPADCKKIRTKVARKNALNPIWNETFNFKINFPELAFVRFEVYDADTNYMLSQRVIPLHCLRPGYRHVRLRSPTNQSLNMASLFIFSRAEEEMAGESCRGDFDLLGLQARRKIHFLVVYGVTQHEPYAILKVTQDTTANEAIAQCLTKAGVCRSSRGSYVLVEEVSSRAPTQRVLGPHERVLRAAAARPGSRLMLKRVGDDPSSRAWLTSIRSASSDRRSKDSQTSDEDATSGSQHSQMDGSPTSDRSASSDRRSKDSQTSDEDATSGSQHSQMDGSPTSDRKDGDSFLVCVHNVSPEIPYAILKVPLSATAAFVVHQSLTKARCHDDPKRFVLVEELEWGGRAGTGPQQRPLADDEVVYTAQASWKTLGRFVLQEKGSSAPLPRHRAAIARIQRGLSITRGAITGGASFPAFPSTGAGAFSSAESTLSPRPGRAGSGKAPIKPAYSDPTSCRRLSTTPLGKGIARAKGHSDKDVPNRPYPQKRTGSREVFRRLGTRLANHRASLSSELGSLWDFLRVDRPDRRRSEPADTSTYEPIHTDTRTPAKLARDLLQVVQETIFARKLVEKPKMCPLVKEESDLTSSEDDRDEKFNTDTRIAHLIDFFFTIVKSQRTEDQRKGSGGSCFRSETSPSDETLEVYTPKKINTELEHKMDTLMEFLATTGCMEKEEEKELKGEKKITLMEFLFGPDDRKWETKPTIEINKTDNDNKGLKRSLSLSESNINDVKDISFIDETPGEEGSETLVEILLKYMENYDTGAKFTQPSKSISLTPSSLSEKSKSDVTISRLETLSDISKTKSDSSLTRTQDTVIDRYEDLKSDKSGGSRRISETVVDLSYIKQDLEEIITQAVNKVYGEINFQVKDVDDVMSEQEDAENFNAYTNPPTIPYIQYLPYSVELSDILEEDEPSSNQFERSRKQESEDATREDTTQDDPQTEARRLAEDLLDEIEDHIQTYPFKKSSSSSGLSTEDFSREMELSPNSKRSSISLIDLRNIPDLPPSFMSKPKVKKVDKSTSTTELSDSNSDSSRRIDSACMTEDTTVSSSPEISERALDKLESLHKFFSKSRLEIIDESLEENGDKNKSTKQVMDSETSISSERQPEYKAGQASLDDVEDIQEDADNGRDKGTETKEEDRSVFV